jgi:tetratricopeptide (TPR) repeat protein
MSAFLDRGRYGEVLRLFESLPAAYREEPVVLYNAGVAYFSLGRLDSARQIFQSIAEEPYGGIRERVAVYLAQIARAQAPVGAAPAAGANR